MFTQFANSCIFLAMDKKYTGLFLFAVVFTLIFAYGCGIKYIGDGMLPTITDGSRYSTDIEAYNNQQPSRGDIVVYHLVNETLGRVDRVIGVSGDVIEIKNGQVILNGAKLNEPYTQGKIIAPDELYEVPDGAVFVLNDNRESADLDSRSLGFIPLAVVQGKVTR